METLDKEWVSKEAKNNCIVITLYPKINFSLQNQQYLNRCLIYLFLWEYDKNVFFIWV